MFGGRAGRGHRRLPPRMRLPVGVAIGMWGRTGPRHRAAPSETNLDKRGENLDFPGDTSSLIDCVDTLKPGALERRPLHAGMTRSRRYDKAGTRGLLRRPSPPLRERGGEYGGRNDENQKQRYCALPFVARLALSQPALRKTRRAEVALWSSVISHAADRGAVELTGITAARCSTPAL